MSRKRKRPARPAPAGYVLEDFLERECTPGCAGGARSRDLVIQAIELHEKSRRMLQFNLFDVELDFEAGIATIHHVLHPWSQSLPIAELLEILRDRVTS